MRLLVTDLRAGRVEVRDEGHHHLAHVLRVRPGARVVLFDGAGSEADAVVASVGDEVIVLEAGPVRGSARPPCTVTLIVALLKGEKMDLVIQKTTELGVARIVPVASERAVVRLEEGRAATRRERWRKIAEEAARQCGRADVPEVGLPTSLEEAWPAGALRLVCHAGAPPLADALGAAADIAIAVGPEGGFTDDEIAHAQAAGAIPVGLGPRILRAETAAMTVVAIALFANGDLGR